MRSQLYTIIMSIKLKLKGFANRRDGFFILITSGLLLLIIGFQQLLPSGKPIPFAKVNGKLTRIQSAEAIIDHSRLAEEQELTLKINDYQATYKIRDLGISVDAQPTVEPYVVESRLKRLIPFSVIAQMYRDNKPSYISSKNSLYIVTSAIADEINLEAKNATILSGPTLKIEASTSGILFEPTKATFAIYDAIAKNQTEVVLKSKAIEPEVTTSELEQAASAFIKTLPNSLQVKTGDKSTVLTKETMHSWLSYDAVDGTPIVKFDNSKLGAYAEELSREFASDELPTTTIINLVDGKEVGRIPGRNGKSIIPEELSTAINLAVKDQKSEVLATLVDVPSPIKYTRNYTRSDAGLEELMDQITAGKEISIQYIDINDRGWDVGSRQHERSQMASTYKMFVVYSVLKRIEAGTMSFNDQVNGKTMDQCLQTVIIDSDNECSIAIAERIGWTTIASEGKALGATGLDWSEELWGTARDATIIPTKLARGEILTEPNRNYMLDLMRRQRFRSGIPSGTPHPVADKVGFIDGWLNDAAIVYAPDMTYVLAIYTKNQSWETVAEITRQVESLAL